MATCNLILGSRGLTQVANRMDGEEGFSLNLSPLGFLKYMNEFTGLDVPSNTHPDKAAAMWIAALDRMGHPPSISSSQKTGA